jgi:hypothetical protein
VGWTSSELVGGSSSSLCPPDVVAKEEGKGEHVSMPPLTIAREGIEVSSLPRLT